MQKNKQLQFDQIVAILDKRTAGGHYEYLVKIKNQRWPMWIESVRLKNVAHLISQYYNVFNPIKIETHNKVSQYCKRKRHLQNIKDINQLGTAGNPIILSKNLMNKQRCLTEKKPSKVTLISLLESNSLVSQKLNNQRYKSRNTKKHIQSDINETFLQFLQSQSIEEIEDKDSDNGSLNNVQFFSSESQQNRNNLYDYQQNIRFSQRLNTQNMIKTPQYIKIQSNSQIPPTNQLMNQNSKQSQSKVSRKIIPSNIIRKIKLMDRAQNKEVKRNIYKTSLQNYQQEQYQPLRKIRKKNINIQIGNYQQYKSNTSIFSTEKAVKSKPAIGKDIFRKIHSVKAEEIRKIVKLKSITKNTKVVRIRKMQAEGENNNIQYIITYQDNNLLILSHSDLVLYHPVEFADYLNKKNHN